MYTNYPPHPLRWGQMPLYNPYHCPCPRWAHVPGCDPDRYHRPIPLRDYGPAPYAVDIQAAAMQNDCYRLALWTGDYLQLTLMTIPPREDIGLEIHEDHDQFIRIEEGYGIAMMGDTKDKLYYQQRVSPGYAVFVPAGKWHNLVNVGCTPLKLYSIYAPPEHPRGTVHPSKRDAEEHHGY